MNTPTPTPSVSPSEDAPTATPTPAPEQPTPAPTVTVTAVPTAPDNSDVLGHIDGQVTLLGILLLFVAGVVVVKQLW